MMRACCNVWICAVVASGVLGCGTGEDAGSGADPVGPGGTGTTERGSGNSACVMPPAVDPIGKDWVNGTATLLNDNGAWCWFQDERAVVDTAKGQLIFSSDANGAGAEGMSRNGQVEITTYDLVAETASRATMGTLVADDHDTGAVVIRPDGNYAAMWAGHNEDCNSYFRTYVDGAWSAQMSFDWRPLGCSLTSGTKVSYSNLWNMTSEGKIYSFVRSIGTSPNLLVSTDQGASWAYGGRLTSTPRVGYVAGYYKYWGNGIDRIDFVGTEAHPRDFDNSLYHGYVKDGKTFDSMDRMIDANVSDGMAPPVTAFTKLFAAGSTVGEIALDHAWNIDLVRYDDGSIALLWSARVQGSDPQNPDHRICYARFDGSNWNLTYLVKGGLKLYASEQDYIGLGALDPDDPHTIYVSTPYDPRDDTTFLGSHEIFRGTTCDNGATWKWTPITANSTRDNLRPIMPKWDATHRALLWFRGTYTSFYSYNTEVVGLITDRDPH